MGLVTQGDYSKARLEPGPGVPASDSLVADLCRSSHTARGRVRVTVSGGPMGASRKQGLISNPRGHGEFVRLTDERLSRAKALVVKLFGTKSIRLVAPMTALGGRPIVRCFLPDGYFWPTADLTRSLQVLLPQTPKTAGLRPPRPSSFNPLPASLCRCPASSPTPSSAPSWRSRRSRRRTARGRRPWSCRPARGCAVRWR